MTALGNGLTGLRFDSPFEALAARGVAEGLGYKTSFEYEIGGGVQVVVEGKLQIRTANKIETSAIRIAAPFEADYMRRTVGEATVSDSDGK